MAPIICKTTRTVYHPAPKSASSSLRAVYFEIENGFPFRPFEISGRPINLFWLYGHHELFKKAEVPDGYETVTVVRDPIDRFVSFYKWGVLDNNCQFDVPIGINEFVADFPRQMNRTPKIRFHLSAQFLFIGEDLSYYDRVFRIEDMAELQSYLSTRAGRPVPVRISNPSSRPKELALTPASRARLAEIYRQDYQLLKDFYQPG